MPESTQRKHPLLEVDHLTKHYPAGRGGQVVRAVEDVSFVLERGESLGLVGESGCGKSTLGRTILRLLEPTAGRVLLDGEVISTLSAARFQPLRRRLQMIFQDPVASLNPRLTVMDLIGEALAVHGLARGAERRQRVVALLARVGLSGAIARRRPHELSGGQCQRVAIARALAVQPDLIIADEPVSSLDLSVQAQIVGLLRRIQEESKVAYLFITHDLRLVAHLCHRVAVMYRGRLVEVGPVERIFRSPRHPYTRLLLDAIPDPVPALRAVLPDAVDGEGGAACHFSIAPSPQRRTSTEGK